MSEEKEKDTDYIASIGCSKVIMSFSGEDIHKLITQKRKTNMCEVDWTSLVVWAGLKDVF